MFTSFTDAPDARDVVTLHWRFAGLTELLRFAHRRPRCSVPILGPDSRDGFAEMTSPISLRSTGASPRCSGFRYAQLAYGTT